MKHIATIVITFLLMFAVSGHAQPEKTSEIDNALLKFSFESQTKTWNLYENVSGEWTPVILHATTSLSFHDGDSLVLSDETGGERVRSESYADAIGKGKKLEVTIPGKRAEWNLSFILYDAQKIVTLSASVKNLSVDEWKPSMFHLLDIRDAGAIAFATANVLMHVNGYQSWSMSEIVPLDSVNRNTSYWSTLFYEPEAYRSLLLGFLTNIVSTNSFLTMPFDAGQNQIHLSSNSDIKTLSIPPQSQFRSDRMMIALDPSPLENLQQYGEFSQRFAPVVNKPFTPTGSVPPARDGKGEVPAGWCSWYYYYQHISEDSILLNLNAAAKHLKKSGLRYIQIDDGYQIAAGDWRTNKKFPHGHKWLVDQIHKKGFLAGLWVAPFAIAESSSVYKRHRDWLLKDAGDTLKEFFANDWWGGRIFSLDPSNPDAQRWLSDLFLTITNEWGYDYVKIDFLYFAGEGGTYRQNVTSAQAYQMGLRAIRRGVGSDKFILGCGAPIGSSVGYVDGMRIGGDVYAAWGGITPGVNAAAHRYQYHNTVWYNDPDCLVVRDPLTIDQARVWASVIALSGQMNMLSDKLPDLPQERMELLQQTLPSYGVSAVSLDLFSAPNEQGLTLRSADGAMSVHLPQRWKFIPGDSAEWKNPAFNDGYWSEVPVPSHWEDSGYPGYDGFVWYRVKFTLPSGWKKGPVNFLFAKVDDCDETYLNGSLVGATGAMPPDYNSEWTTFRDYALPESLVNWSGENTLAVRVYDGGGPGGIFSTKQLSLPSTWMLNVEKPFDRWSVAGIFNWTNAPATQSVNRTRLGLSAKKSYVVYERWQDRYLGELHDSLQLSLAPNSSAILTLHEKISRPFILSTSRHIVSGAIDLADEQWDLRQQTLSVNSHNLLNGRYSVCMYIPEGFALSSVVAPVSSTVTTGADGMVRIEFPNIQQSSFAWKVKFR